MSSDQHFHAGTQQLYISMDPVWQCVSAVVVYEAVFYTAIHINSIKPRGHCSRPNAGPLLLHNYAESHWLWFRNYQRAEQRGWESRCGEEASLIEFYVVAVGDLNMPEFITRRIIMSYKNWQSQIGPRTSSLPHPLPSPFQMNSHSLAFLLKMKHLCLTLEEKINMNL